MGFRSCCCDDEAKDISDFVKRVRIVTEGEVSANLNSDMNLSLAMSLLLLLLQLPFKFFSNIVLTFFYLSLLTLFVNYYSDLFLHAQTTIFYVQHEKKIS